MSVEDKHYFLDSPITPSSPRLIKRILNGDEGILADPILAALGSCVMSGACVTWCKQRHISLAKKSKKQGIPKTT
jgi:hypothetical protein